MRLISKIELEQNFQSTISDVHASANERPPLLSGLDQLPHLEVPYPLTNGVQLRYASGRYPELYPFSYIYTPKILKG